MNCSETVTVEFIYIIVPQTYTICGGIYMQINSLPAGGAVGVGEIEVSPVTLYTRDGNSSLRLGLESHLSRINKDLGLDLDSWTADSRLDLDSWLVRLVKNASHLV